MIWRRTVQSVTVVYLGRIMMRLECDEGVRDERCVDAPVVVHGMHEGVAGLFRK